MLVMQRDVHSSSPRLFVVRKPGGQKLPLHTLTGLETHQSGLLHVNWKLGTVLLWCCVVGILSWLVAAQIALSQC